MTLLGITGFEDIIQAEAKRTVLDFQEANIKVWMLTGDAEATAREIAFQTGVFAVKEKRETNKKTDKL
jgi:P-type E1-E2 ATPase